jgi:predicted TIM-barrel fold metal-dependent hydrolase
MIDGMFVFDNVIHLSDTTDANLRADVSTAAQERDSSLRFVGAGGGRTWSVEEMYDIVFVQSPTDLAMAQVVPIFDWYMNWFAPVELQHKLATAYPDRVLFCGGVDPVHRGLADAIDQLDYQKKELGACSFKFYNGHDRGSWRCDDEKVAYPLYEKSRSLGVNVLQFHKGVPFGLQDMDYMRPVDLQAPARDYPDMTFIIQHLAYPYLDEAIFIAARFPNVYLCLSGIAGLILTQPRFVTKIIGRLLMGAGPEKILWGSEAALAGVPAAALKLFMELEMPEDLRTGYGYPEFTREDKEKILGLNFAQIMGIDLDQKRAELGLDSRVGTATATR